MTQHQIKRIGRGEGGEEGRKGGGGGWGGGGEGGEEGGRRGGKKSDQAESLVKVVYTCTINYPPPQLLIFGTNPLIVVS